MTAVVYTDEFGGWFDDLSAADQDAVARVVGLLEAEGTDLGFPYSSAIEGSSFPLRELRIKSRGRQLRVFYAFDPRREAVLLIGGDKTGDDRFYKPSSEKPRLSGRSTSRSRKQGSMTRSEPMKTHSWNDLRKKRFTPEQIEEQDRWVREKILEMNLRAVRELVGKTQIEVAKAAKMTQSELSKAERREDHLLSTLRRYVEALGGELVVVAKFGDKMVRLKGV